MRIRKLKWQAWERTAILAYNGGELTFACEVRDIYIGVEFDHVDVG
jgi:hypothetical protein